MTIVELVGVTASGKTTLCGELEREMAGRGGVVRSPEDVVLGKLSWRPRRTSVIRWLMAEAFVVPAIVASTRAPDSGVLREVARLALDVHGDGWLHRANIMRNFQKRLALDRSARRSTEDGLVLVDEGLLQVAHGLFVSHRSEPRMDLVERYAQAVPLPDVVVRVVRDWDALSRVFRDRGHKRVPVERREAADAYLDHAHRVLEALCSHARVSERVVLSNNPETTDGWGASVGDAVFSLMNAGRKP